MDASRLYHEGNRALQDRFQSRALADRFEQLARVSFSPRDRSFITEAGFFFLATADAEGRPDVSFKGGPAGFVQLIGDNQLVFPDYDGNGMFKSLGNIGVNPHVTLLFIAMTGRRRRLRVAGTATVSADDPLIATTVGAQLIVRVTATAIFSNCPRYIPDLAANQPSPFVPVPGQPVVEPAWKDEEGIRDVIPPRAPTFGG